MSYAKNFYVDRAIQDCNFPPDNNGRIANLLIPFAAYSAKKKGLDISSTVGQALQRVGGEPPVLNLLTRWEHFFYTCMNYNFGIL